MTQEMDYLEHIGLVTDNCNGRVKISLVGSGCSACHKSLCMLGDSKSKEVEISSSGNNFQAGDEVLVRVNPASGYKAVAFLYLLPFILILLVLMFLLQRGYSEGIAGLGSLLILIPYFGMVYGFRKQIGSNCTLEVEKR